MVSPSEDQKPQPLVAVQDWGWGIAHGIILVSLVSLAVYWLAAMQNVGLHADESQLALYASDFLRNGISRPYGMNYYTGILQIGLESVVFSLWGIGVPQIRAIGVLFNSFAMIFLFFFAQSVMGKNATLFLASLFAQSALYLFYPVIGWEVCSFTLFFTALVLVSLYKVSVDVDDREKLWAGAFLFASMLGVYNHAIFSLLLAGGFMGLFLWDADDENKSNQLRTLAYLSLAITNFAILLLYEQLIADSLFSRAKQIALVAPLLLVAAELAFRDSAISVLKKLIRSTQIHPKVRRSVKAILLVSLALSVLVHGFPILRVMTKEVVIERVLVHPPE